MKDEFSGGEREFREGDPVWDVLGRAGAREASPWFVDRVMRGIASEREDPIVGGAMAWWRWALPLGAAGFLAFCGVLGADGGQSRAVGIDAVVDFELIDSLDLMVGGGESTLWLDETGSWASF